MKKPPKPEIWESRGRQRPVSIVTKDKDPLAEVAQEAKAAACTHPHVRFARQGFQIECLDCPRRWVAAMDQNGIKYDMADFGYYNPAIPDGEFRHSPNEAPRILPIR